MLGIRFGAMASSLATAAGNFQTGSYIGTGGTKNVVFAKLFQPDLVVIFDIAGATLGWPTFDSINGVKKYFDFANNSSLTTDNNSLTSFNSNGFTLGTSSVVNASGHTYQYFAWKKATNFFDIETYTGNGANQNISHNLTSAPLMITEMGQSIPVMGSTNLATSNPWNNVIDWGNSTITVSASSTFWNNTAPTSSVFTISTNLSTNGVLFTAYLWGTGDGNSSFGTYTGNGSTSGPSVSGLGFTPSCVMILQQSPVSSNLRVVYGNSASGELNLDSAASSTNFINLVSGGFNVVTTNADFNTSGTGYQYMAWA